MANNLDMDIYNEIDYQCPKNAKDLESISRWLHSMVEDAISSYVQDSENELLKSYSPQY